MDNLKPCPWCGQSVFMTFNNQGAFILCKNCGYRLEPTYLQREYGMGLLDDQEIHTLKVVNWWNGGGNHGEV